MPDNTLTPDCLHRVGGAQLFMAPTWNPEQKGVKVQIIDVFALELATGYDKDPETVHTLHQLRDNRQMVGQFLNGYIRRNGNTCGNILLYYLPPMQRSVDKPRGDTNNH